MGKTTLANEFPKAVFIQTEEGENAIDEITTFGRISSYENVMWAIAELTREPHVLETVVVDSIDRLEPLVNDAVCVANNWKSIEAPGYGIGYAAAETLWLELINDLDNLRKKRNMSVVLIGHSEINRFDDPRSSSYSRYDFRLNKKPHAVLQNEMDLIICLNQEASITEEKTGFGSKRAVASNVAQRWMYVELTPTMNAGNRYGMPPRIPFVRGQGYTALAQYFPHEKERTETGELIEATT